jgi:hypothetical protein
MSLGKTFLNLTPGWVRRTVDTGVQQALLILRASNFYADNIYDKAGSGAPAFPNGLKTNTISERTTDTGVTIVDVLIPSVNVQHSVQDVAASTATLDGTKYFVGVSYTVTGTVTITLPAAAALIGVPITIADTGANAAANNITINRAGSDTIIGNAVGQTSAIISSNGSVLRFIAINATTYKVW